ncbi:DUF6415 family natural product biosynthesis protein [Streptomyces sp. NPDC052101]|uniref:DUF6415 family natural product biosynthesis protein n=1 Tax=Streptomyces sp. NPDC052101 TaxID=3155763 RepID=UPI003437A9E7
MKNGTASPGAVPRGGMTMWVYTVDRYGSIIHDRGTVTVAYGNQSLPPVMSTAYPPCECSRCRHGQGDAPVNATVEHGDGDDSDRMDIATMRKTASELLGPNDEPDALPLASNDLDTLSAMLRGQLELLIPEVDQQARRLPKDSIPRYCALACVGEASRKLRVGEGCTPSVRVAVARKLARSVKALCDHYEKLTGEGPASERS